MMIGDYLRTRRGSIYRVESINELDEVKCYHVNGGVSLPPIPRSVLEHQTQNISAHAWDKTFVDLDCEIHCPGARREGVAA